ncbi:bifunctional riboflavin kinase/FAD synthetase [Jeongeupia naejangsanensis]|uniref:Riboflavin biosynthesis protein n=1 Tax=Jeongeupia naejangsanensis TaxID=613195 RepID=A0ABS2BHT7_9NEIS|nr:bifunctional riboflavin kinase/FAD synthetase [Jeongeupia naejangsanensis]MBM3114364.1 bifunctional riboflavin kinase/FAD synthetase [Jeongeupia naejangsanensis]
MQVVRGVAAAHLPPCALTIGNFDGLHLGHQAMLSTVRSAARERGLATAVLTFEPHPRELFTPESAPARLTSFREKTELLAAEGIDYLVVQRFDRRFASYEAEAFRDEIIARRLNARFVVVGDDFCFGARRAGNIALLAQSSVFEAHALPTIARDEERVSSTAVRAALAGGQMAHAAELLGRPYSISGRVIGGDRLGRQLGFPTANIQLRHNRPPMMGVFVVEAHGLERPWQGVASLGVRPTVKGADAAPVLEVHLFDFNRQIYGEHLRVDFLAKLRDEEKYSGLEPLIAQIHKDCDQARDWFATRAQH